MCGFYFLVLSTVWCTATTRLGWNRVKLKELAKKWSRIEQIRVQSAKRKWTTNHKSCFRVKSLLAAFIQTTKRRDWKGLNATAVRSAAKLQNNTHRPLYLEARRLWTSRRACLRPWWSRSAACTASRVSRSPGLRTSGARCWTMTFDPAASGSCISRRGQCHAGERCTQQRRPVSTRKREKCSPWSKKSWRVSCCSIGGKKTQDSFNCSQQGGLVTSANLGCKRTTRH